MLKFLLKRNTLHVMMKTLSTFTHKTCQVIFVWLFNYAMITCPNNGLNIKHAVKQIA